MTEENKGYPSHEMVEEYIRNLVWSESATDAEKTLIAGNIRGFAGFLNRGNGVERIIVDDDSGHDYVIPLEKKGHWEDWLGSEEWEGDDVPGYAERIDGGSVIFTNYRVG